MKKNESSDSADLAKKVTSIDPLLVTSGKKGDFVIKSSLNFKTNSTM